MSHKLTSLAVTFVYNAYLEGQEVPSSMKTGASPLPRLQQELTEAGKPLEISFDQSEDIIRECLKAQWESRRHAALVWAQGCYGRANKDLLYSRGFGHVDPAPLADLQDLLINYSVQLLCDASLLGTVKNYTEATQTFSALLRHTQMDFDFCGKYLNSLSQMPEYTVLIIPLINTVFADLAYRTMSSPEHFLATRIVTLCQMPTFAKTLSTITAFHTPPPGARASGWDLEFGTLMSWFLRATPLDTTLPPPPKHQTVSARQHYFGHPLNIPQLLSGEVSMARDYDTLIDQYEALVSTLVRVTPQSREAFFTWLFQMLGANKKRRQLHNHAVGQMTTCFMLKSRGICSNGLSISLFHSMTTLLLRFKVHAKPEDILPLSAFLRTPSGRRLKALHDLTPAASLEDAPPPVKDTSLAQENFPSTLFWATVACAMVLFRPATADYRQMCEDVADQPRDSPVFLEKQADLRQWRSALIPTRGRRAFMKFSSLVQTVFLQCAFPDGKFGKITKIPPSLEGFPEEVLQDVMLAYDAILRSTQPDDKLGPMTDGETLVNFASSLMLSADLVRNPHIRSVAGAEPLLLTMVLDEQRVVETKAAEAMLIPAIVESFIEANHAGHSGRIEQRWSMMHILGKALKHTQLKQSLRQYSTSEIDNFQRFFHLLISSILWTLEETLLYIRELRRRERGGTATEVPEDEDSEGALLKSMEDAKLKAGARNLYEGLERSLGVASIITCVAAPSIGQSQNLLIYLVGCSNEILYKLVGKGELAFGRQELQRIDGDLDPLVLTDHICDIFTHIYNEESLRALLLQTIKKEDRFYSEELYKTARSTMRVRRGRRSCTFGEIVKSLKDTIEEEDLWDDDDVPEEFIDPIIGDVMKDPVILPCGKSVERQHIERHLMEEAFDPFNRAPLKKSQLVPNDELREKIRQFFEDKKNAKLTNLEEPLET